jgi:hypothetical protein
MRYMLLIYRDDKWWENLSVQDRGKIFQDAVEYSDRHRASGFYLGGDPLEPISTATTVRMKDGNALLTDGPFAETKEQLAGYTMVEAKDLDEVLAFTTRHPLVKAGLSIEVRPVRVGAPK